MGRKIQAVTFDLWDTVFADDSDEPRRKARGLRSKKKERRHLVQRFISKHEPIQRSEVDTAYGVADAAFIRVWYGQNVTWTVRDRLEVLLKGLGRTLPEEELAELIRLHEEMELNLPPDLIPGVAGAIESLAGRYRLGVVSDAVFSPGRALRKMLDKEGIASHFEAFAFSDEVGRSKPDPGMFETVFASLDVQPHQVVHLGDREEKDIAGAQAVGARAVLVTAARDRGSENTRADAVCDDYRDLPAILEKLSGD